MRKIPDRTIVFICTLILFLGTSEILPLSWDEGEYIDRARNAVSWFSAENPVSKESIAKHWQLTTQKEGHPAGFVAVIASGKTISARILPFLSQKTQWRFGPILLVSFAILAVWSKLRTEYGMSCAILCVAAIPLVPRLFAHSHYAGCDSVLIASWMLFWASFDDSMKTPPGGVKCGLALGLTLSAKFTGWMTLAPLLFAAILGWKSFRESHSVLLVPPVALAVFFILNPPLWYGPVEGFAKFVFLNTHREGLNVSILFLGEMYDLHHPLPWYNTIFWTAVTVPPGMLLLFLIGAFQILRNESSRAGGVFLLMNIAILLVMRALPGTPPHDGIRLFVAAFPFIAILAGFGAACLWRCKSKWKIPRRIAIALLYGSAVFQLYWYAPQWLSYYNILIGGLPGAQRLGMEPTYYWDALDHEVLDWINENTPEGEKVRFSACSNKTLQLYREWGELKPKFRQDDDGPTRWYVLQRRPSGEMPRDVMLIEGAKPVFTKTIRSPRILSISEAWKFDSVPLIEIYRYEDYEKCSTPAPD